MRTTPLDVVQETVMAAELLVKLDRDVIFVIRFSSMFSYNCYFDAA